MIPDLTQWDVVRVRIRPGDKEPHPAVVISRAAVCADERTHVVNVLYGTTKRPALAPGQTDVALNSAEGLDQLTLINCDHMYTVHKNSVESRIGRVTPERRRALCRTLKLAYSFLV